MVVVRRSEAWLSLITDPAWLPLHSDAELYAVSYRTVPPGGLRHRPPRRRA